ncbi:MAG TPA: SPFH domain-containing protein [Pirellulales bacterium]|nr:SPFH domain-containing protein [Pirellulales bacterium]
MDRLKFDGPADVLAWKYPYEDIKLGSQLVVNESQQAILARDGRHLATFGPGRHTLTSANIPILGKLVDLPFGGVTPFAAEVWFFNMVADLQVKFGTATPIQVREPHFEVMLPVRAHGQLGLRVGDCRTFLRELVGTMAGYTSQQVYGSFRGMIVSKVKQVIAGAIATDRIPPWEIATSLDLLSRRCHDAVRAEFARFGLSIVNLHLTDVSVPEDDPVVRRLRSTVLDRAGFEMLGDRRYAAARGFDVLEQAAQNSGPTGGALGAGLGVSLAAALGAQAAFGGFQTPQTAHAAAVAARLAELKTLLDQGLVTQAEYDAKRGTLLNEL